MINTIRKTIKSLRNNGLKFTCAMVKYYIFGGEDPRTWQEHYDRYAKQTEVSYLKEKLAPYTNSPGELPSEAIYHLNKMLLPIDCYFDSTASNKRLNLVLEHFDSCDLSDSLSAACALAAAFAHQSDIELRIISRNSPSNAKKFISVMQTLGVTLPKKITFYTDMDQDISGNSQYKLAINSNDLFMATSWKTAISVSKTTFLPKYLYYLSDSDLDYQSPGSESHLSFISNHAVIIVETADQWAYLLRFYPHLLKTAVCLEHEGKINTLTYMENQIKWK